jgi:hypothetical protein
MRLLPAIGIVALIVAAIPLAIISGIFSRSRKCTPRELASELNELAAGEMGGWDQLECVPIKDPRLEAIRQEAMAVHLPFREEDHQLLKHLAAKAAALQPLIPE